MSKKRNEYVELVYYNLTFIGGSMLFLLERDIIRGRYFFLDKDFENAEELVGKRPPYDSDKLDTHPGSGKRLIDVEYPGCLLTIFGRKEKVAGVSEPIISCIKVERRVYDHHQDVS